MKLTIVIALAAATCLQASAQTARPGSMTQVPEHPRILMLKGEEKAVLRSIAADPAWQKVQQAIFSESDRLLSVPPVERIKIGRRLLGKSREALRRLFFLSYSWRMTQQASYAARAEKEMLAIAAFSDWNPSHFLDVAEMTMAMAIGYDWLYTQLSPTSRQVIKRAIIDKGLLPSLLPQNNSWLKAEHNWNQVCNAGMTYGAIAVMEDSTAFAQSVINRAVETVVTAMEAYSPDGGYPEGYSYWGYGTSFNVLLNSALEKLFHTDFRLNSKPGFLKTGGFLENMVGPTGLPFNYSDAGREAGLEPAMFWFAAKEKDPSLLWTERRYLQKDAQTMVNDRLLPALLIWKGQLHLSQVQPPASTVWVGQGRNPVALMRTSWTDPNAIYVAAKGGSASVNHAHMDIGSFVMDANGERWAMDFGMQDYESLESKGLQIFGRTQDAQRWTVFRYVNQAHNTLTLDNRHQLVAGYAPITGSSADPAFMNAVIDLSAVYKGTVTKAMRGIAIANKQYVVIKDEITTGDSARTVRWNMVTPAEVKITGKNEALLTRNGKQLLLRVEAPGNITMKTWPTDPPNSYDAPNPGTVMTGFETQLPAHTTTTLTVYLLPEKAMQQKTPATRPLSNWSGK
jgi:hypothetical protein